MSWPTPEPGLVVRYAYLWKHEAALGRDEATKDRPCAVVLAVADDNGRTRVIVLPITHVEPRPPDEGVELPVETKARLGLDDARSWIVVS